MYDQQESETLLQGKGYSLVEKHERGSLKKLKESRLSKAFVICSVTANVVLVLAIIFQWWSMPLPNLSFYAGLKQDTLIPWSYGGEFVSHNLTDLHKLWLDESIDVGMVALPDTFVAEKRLPTSQRFPWDQKKGIYLLNAHHNLHCLRVLALSIIEYRGQRSQSRGFDHIVHCLNDLREDIRCNADDTPRWTSIDDSPESGIGQQRLCRSWEQLEDWASMYNSCYKFTNQTATSEQYPQVLRFMHCPEGSPYVESVTKAKKLLESHSGSHS